MGHLAICDAAFRRVRNKIRAIALNARVAVLAIRLRAWASFQEKPRQLVGK
jgi:hypothetical protein